MKDLLLETARLVARGLMTPRERSKKIREARKTLKEKIKKEDEERQVKMEFLK